MKIHLDIRHDISPTIAKKSSNKIGPKFHKGEWIVWNEKFCRVNDDGCGYGLIDQNGLRTSLEYGTIDENAHLWDISDAKEGDVLAYVTDDEDLWIMIYMSLYEPYEGHVHYHALLANDNFTDKGTCCISIKNLKPATKEQRDTLMKAMDDAGWEFDFEKKELKKLTQQEVTKISDQVKDYAWSKEDEVWKQKI